MRNFLIKCVAKAKFIDFFNDLLRYNPLYYRQPFNLTKRFKSSNRDERIAITEELTRRTLNWARAANSNAPSSNRLEDWPYLEKDVVRDNINLVRNSRVLSLPASTGGTTGLPLKLWRSLRSVASEQAFFDIYLSKWNYSFRSARIACLRGDNVKSPTDRQPPFGIQTIGGKRLILSSQHLSEDTVQWYINALTEFDPEILWIYPSTGESLARHIDNLGLKLDIPLILCGSEVLHNSGRRIMEKVFQSSLFEYYGLAERVIMASSEKENEYWINPAYGHLELIPVSVPDTPGSMVCAEIVATGYWDTAMPLVRYKTGDRMLYPSHYTPEDIQDIALGLKPFFGLGGRDNDILISPRGDVLVGIDHLPRELDGIIRMQVIQETTHDVRILIIPDSNYNDRHEAALMKNVRLKIPEDMKVTVKIVSKLETLPSGKSPFVIRKI